MNKHNYENNISCSKNILLILNSEADQTKELEEIIEFFPGKVIYQISDLPNSQEIHRIYALGNFDNIETNGYTFNIVEEFSKNFSQIDSKFYTKITLGQVPLNVHNAGIFYRELFDKEDVFNLIKNEHQFQNLTESNKSSMALRKGIYLTKVKKEEKKNEADHLHFRLLRCSSNLTGPTENFRKTDDYIVDTINHLAQFDFETITDLNHVLAQIYENRKKGEFGKKDVKAKIKAHSDKTKDMPTEGLIAFCTFYDKPNFDKLTPSKTDRFDWVYKKSSGLTRLLFRLKPTVNNPKLVKEFSVTLYPNSAFIISLSTNRLYTHEIRPSVLNIDQIPTRMGYVIRCSNLEATYTENGTLINENGKLVKLKPMKEVEMEDLRANYYEENKLETKVNYGNVHFSMNNGDYEKPIY